MSKTLILLFLILCLGCGLTTTRPKQEMSYAQAAFLAAKQAKAEVHAPQLYRKAELLYLKAKSAYKRKYFNKAKEYAEQCQKFSEQAEYQAFRKVALGE
tara:strand:- start:38774 stop:39070 length:297 start_codon:yes stop_codon:yes gene_type:complete